MAAPWDERLTLNEFERRWKQLRKHTITTHLDELENDPFDCSSMKIPPAFGLVEDAIQGYVDEWRELDERKVVNQGESMPKWYEKHIRLPDNFDYESRNPQAPEDDGKGERVLSLEDPSQTLSHAQELWKLFHRVPTVEELEARATKDPKLEHMRALLNEQMEQTSNADALALSRLRVCDRHQFPPIFLSDREGAVPTIRFELWRRMLKRGVSSDSNRMVLEFLGSQTLLDVHKTIVELSEDELWKGDDNGFFFIEGTFYTNGSTDYVTPIKQWLASGTKESQSSRAEFLGLTSFDSLESVHMDKVRLDSISFRLGFRCVHVHHGDVECSIFATDRRLINPPPSVSFPIIHDVWAQPASQPDCEACTHAPATLATSTTCEITNGHTMLCHSCARQLQIPPEQLEKFAVWRFQPNLSTGASSNHTF